LLTHPGAGILESGKRHWDILRDLARDGQAAGPVVMDAALAAIALEHGATVLHHRSRLLAVLRARVDEPSRSERLTEFEPRPVRVSMQCRQSSRAMDGKPLGLPMPADLATFIKENLDRAGLRYHRLRPAILAGGIRFARGDAASAHPKSSQKLKRSSVNPPLRVS
jgi:hypothetical protein